MNKKRKITPALLKKHGKSCGNCQHFDEEQGLCFAIFRKGQSARGARAEDKYCGMIGKHFLPIKEVKAPVQKPTKNMTIDQLQALDTSQMSPQERGAIVRRINKMKAEQNKGK